MKKNIPDFTRMGTPPPNFPSSVIVQADVNGKVTLNAAVFGTYLGCDSMTADLAFIATRLPNRPNSDQFTEIQPMDSNSISCMIYPNPSQGIFDVIVKSKDESRGILPVVSLFDMAGRMLDKRQMTGAREQFNFLFLEKGCYLVEVNYDKHMLYKKIIIQ